MEEFVDGNVFDRLFSAIANGDVSAIVGTVLLVLVAMARFLSKDRFSVAVGSWISVISSLIAGVSASLLAGTVWWNALLIGLFVMPTSFGFWEKTRSLLPPRPGSAGILFLVVISFTGFGCDVRRAQVSVQTALTTTAEGVGAADAIVAAAIPEASEEALEELNDELGEIISEVDRLDLYMAEMAPYYGAARSLESSAAALRSAQALLNIWIATRNLPASFGEVCSEAGESVGELLLSLEAAEIEIPELLSRVPLALEAACLLVVNFVEGVE